MKHTPGPWTVSDGIVRSEYGKALANVCMAGNGETVPNARLIAAAPELLEACAAAKLFLEPDLVEPGRTVFWKLVDALAKARGE